MDLVPFSPSTSAKVTEFRSSDALRIYISVRTHCPIPFAPASVPLQAPYGPRTIVLQLSLDTMDEMKALRYLLVGNQSVSIDHLAVLFPSSLTSSQMWIWDVITSFHQELHMLYRDGMELSHLVYILSRYVYSESCMLLD